MPAVDRVHDGLIDGVRGLSDQPPQDRDPLAHEAFPRGSRDYALGEALYPYLV